MGWFKRERPGQNGECELDPELEDLKARAREAHLPVMAERAALQELERLEKTQRSSSEYSIGINYLNFLLSLPWNSMSEDNLDINRALEVLDRNHYGLEEVKERIVEYMAVRRLRVLSRPEIILVDDEAITLENLGRTLAKEGYQVTKTQDPEEALCMIQKRKFHLLVTDLKMQGLDGLQLLERAKKLNPELESIVITAYPAVDAAVQAMKKGSYTFLSKPFRLEEFLEAVRGALARRRVALQPQGPILCFVGPPGTGKTSMGRAIAESLGRKFVSMSLAGLKDESQIRGHRRTYVGALPGRVLQEIKRADVKNPVFMLDEIDKMGQDFKGDPAMALLELLDPEQNKEFLDHYLEIPFDLSRVMFIATANTVDTIPLALLDRLEVMYLPGYTEEEKVQIAFRHLIPRELESAGLTHIAPKFTEDAVRKIIAGYTREPGVRNLTRQIASICRKLAVQVLSGTRVEPVIDTEQVEEALGSPRFTKTLAETHGRIGVATGLAWTPEGGEIVLVEATRMPGKGNLILTGSLGDIMKESALAGLSYIRSNASALGLPTDPFSECDVHVHIPAGAIPKDGPSAGLTIFVAMLSAFRGVPVKAKVATTGEISLTGRVLPVRGLKEKLLAAMRAGIEKVLYPQMNDRDIEGLGDEIKRALVLVPVEDVMQSIGHVF
jgi:ATP-dependent Lon protease